MFVGQIPVGGSTDFGSEYWTDTQGWALLNLWSEECQGHRQRQHRKKHNGHTPSLGIDIKIPDPATTPSLKAGTYRPRHGDRHH